MPNFDAIRIGVIKKIKGEAIAISRDGTMRVLHKGDEIYLGDDIKTSENSNLTIVFDDGEKAYVGFSSVFHTINVFAEHKGEQSSQKTQTSLKITKNTQMTMIKSPIKSYLLTAHHRTTSPQWVVMASNLN